MKCPKCANTSDFNVFFDQLFKVQFQGEKLDSVKESGSDFAQIYPVFCGRCGDMDIEFDHKELEKIRREIEASK